MGSLNIIWNRLDAIGVRMSDIPPKPEKLPEAGETKPLSDSQRKRIEDAVSAKNFPEYNPDEQSQNTDVLSRESKGDETKQKLVSLENFSSDQATKDIQDSYYENPDKAETFDSLDQHFGADDLEKYRLLEASKEIPDFKVIDKPTIVFRYHDGVNAYGRWVTPEYIPDIKVRQDKCSLPSSGSLADRYELQPGCRVLDSIANEMYFPYDEGGNFYRPGGARQFFILDLNKMKKV